MNKETMNETKQELVEMEREAQEMEKADARAVAIAKERKAAKKKKARKRNLLIFLIVAVLIALTAAGYFIRKKHLEEAQNRTVNIVAEAGQNVVYGQIDSIEGNELTYTVLQQSEITGEIPEGRMQSETTGEIPEGRMQSETTGEIAEGRMNPADTGETAEGMMRSQGIIIDAVSYELTDETRTVLIPVGTDVTTVLGTVTTFSRLGTGDNIALVMDADSIVSIYIRG